jgi:hypothetical protein
VIQSPGGRVLSCTDAIAGAEQMTRNEVLDTLNDGREVTITNGEYAMTGSLDYSEGWVISESVCGRYVGLRSLRSTTVTKVCGRTIYVNTMPKVIED